MAEEEAVVIEEIVPVEEGAGPVPVLKWDQGLFEQIVRGFQFPAEWDVRYPQQGQTAADAPPGYITLFADFFIDGKFRLPATHFMATILHFYRFHISQMNPMGMVRVRHFEFVWRSQGQEPSVEKFRVFYQLICNMGFYSFALRNVKKILINLPKSFHDWKMKFFFVKEEVIPIAMIFQESDKIEKEELPIPKSADWYMRLMANPNRIFGKQVLVAAGMSDKWPERSEEVPVLMFNCEVAQLYQSAFPTFGGAMGVRPLGAGEVYWYEQIKSNFLYPPAGIFANPPAATEGAQLPKPRPLRGVTSAGKEILYLSSEESVGSLHEKLSSWSNIFASVLHDLGIDPEEKLKKAPAKKKAPTRKKVTVYTGATNKKTGGSRATAAVPEKGTLRFRQSNLEDYVVASDSLKGLSCIGEKNKSSAAASKSSRSAGSRAPESSATPSSLPEEEEEEEEVEEEGVRLVTRIKSREETTAGTTPPRRG
ncbi:hypothetical protein HanOQP8_Chr17g0651061 [Helianthus annuus]|nr:hypothetical protein HanOQP8_Chr17g0651061 [Helianthus annuus]KAJ0812160.1 hypothetical protein HanPSC8_Chr17g0758791 [Helianthus annuus]